MKYTALASMDEDVSTVAFGTAPLGQLFGPVPLDHGLRTVQEAIELGINLFDTSPYYGDGEERLGIALRGRRDEVLISTKAGRYPGEVFDFSPTRIRDSLHNSLRLLRTDYVDVFFLHDVDFVDIDGIAAESIDTAQDLKAEGKCRIIGTSGYGLGAAKRIILEADPRIGEQIKWNAPSFGYAGADRVTMRLQPGDRLQLIFHRGAKVRDSAGFEFEDGSGLMEWVAPDRAVLTLRDLEDVRARRPVLQNVVPRWIAATS